MRRKWLIACSTVLGMALWAFTYTPLYSQVTAPVFQNCGGSFTPNFNCILSGQYNFTNTSVLQGVTYSTPYAIGGVTVSGTAADQNTIHTATVTMTNAQVLSLSTSTPITVIAAPPQGYVLKPIGGLMMFKYTGAYTVGSSDDLRLYYGNRATGPAASNVIETTGFLSATANTVTSFSGGPDDELTISASVTTPVAIVLQNTSGVPFTGGNAANSVTVKVQYLLYPTGF